MASRRLICVHDRHARCHAELPIGVVDGAYAIREIARGRLGSGWLMEPFRADGRLGVSVQRCWAVGLELIADGESFGSFYERSYARAVRLAILLGADRDEA